MPNFHENETFKDLQLSGETFSELEFYNCEFINCTLGDIKFKDCNFLECKFEKCKILNIKARYSQITNAKIVRCNMIGIHWDEFIQPESISSLIESIKDSTLKYNNFLNANLRKLNFSENIIQEAMFDNCNLSECDFRQCRLDKSQFSNCNLQKADFRDATGYQIDILTSRIKGAKFSFPEAVNLLNSLDIQID